MDDKTSPESRTFASIPAKEEERLAGVQTIISDHRSSMRDHIKQHIAAGAFYGTVAAVLRDCTSINNN